MKSFLFIPLLLASLIGAGQVSQKKSEVSESKYGRIQELTLLQKLDSSLVSGYYLAPVGVDDGAALELMANGKFREITQPNKIDSGAWSIEGKQVILKSISGNGIYDVVQYDRYLFLVLISARKDFIGEFARALNSTKKNEDSGPSFSYWVVKNMRIIFYHKTLN